jgi:hypothetical protein
MSKVFNRIEQDHQELLQRQESEADILADVQAFIEECLTKSSRIYQSSEREQLRTYLRYWSSYVYEKTGEFPNIDLKPISTEAKLAKRRNNAIRGGIIAFSMLGLIFLGWLVSSQVIMMSEPPPTQEPMSSLGQDSTATAKAKLSLTPTLSPSPTITLTSTLQPTVTYLPNETDTASISVKIASPAEGEQVLPRIEFSGTYNSLQPGWAIHVVAQPVLQGEGKLYPLEEYFTVPEGTSSGSWVITGRLGKENELEKAETYNLRVVVTTDESQRDQLNDAIVEGTSDLPNAVIPFPQVITVERGAYKVVNETRIVFPYKNTETRNVDVFSVLPDGSDLLQLFNTPQHGERCIDISKNGEKLLFIARIPKENDKYHHAIFTLKIGSLIEPKIILEAPDEHTVYEGAVWSPNGRYIVFTIGEYDTDKSRTIWDLGLYDTSSESYTRLTNDEALDRYPSWIDNQTILFTGRMKKTSTSGFASFDITTQEIGFFYDTDKEELRGVLSPNGQYLAYQVQLEGMSNEIYAVDLSTQNSKGVRLTNNYFEDRAPVWSPESDTIYYVTFTTSQPSIRAVEIDGKNDRKIFEGEFGITCFTLEHLSMFVPKYP